MNWYGIAIGLVLVYFGLGMVGSDWRIGSPTIVLGLVIVAKSTHTWEGRAFSWAVLILYGIHLLKKLPAYQAATKRRRQRYEYSTWHVATYGEEPPYQDNTNGAYERKWELYADWFEHRRGHRPKQPVEEDWCDPSPTDEAYAAGYSSGYSAGYDDGDRGR